MNLGRLTRAELVAIVGGVLLAISVFLSWFATKGDGEIDGQQGSFSAWDTLSVTRILLLLAAIAPLVLAYIIARDHALSWPRGELTAVIAIAALGLVLYNGLAARPGTSNSLVSLEFGWYLAVVATLLMLGGSAVRSSGGERPRKPPGQI
jgi:amino acid transporter